MKFMFLFFIYLFTGIASAQLPSSAAKFYRGDEAQSKSIYDSLTQKWKVTEYHSGGIIASEEIFEKDGITPTDTLKAYFIDGTLTCKAVFKKGCLSGEFMEWYRNGKIKRQGEYFNCFRTGLWTEYYQNGQKKSEGRYAMSREDSLDESRSRIDSERVEQEAIIFPGITYTSVTTTTLKGEVIKEEMIPDTSCRRFNLPYIVATPKNGIWKYWDEQGNLLNEEIYFMGVADRVRIHEDKK